MSGKAVDGGCDGQSDDSGGSAGAKVTFDEKEHRLIKLEHCGGNEDEDDSEQDEAPRGVDQTFGHPSLSEELIADKIGRRG
jgi:hypothetical protein